MFSILKKELQGLFGTYTAYVTAAAFVLICSLFLWFFDNEYNIFNTGNASLNSFFFITPWVLLFLVPALTMRSIAGEQQSGTLQWLFTQPIKIKHIIIAKYLAVALVALFILTTTLGYIYTLQQIKLESDQLDYGVIASAYLGLFMLGLTFAAIGVFTSSATANPILAYISSVFICFFLFYGLDGLASYNLLGTFDFYVQKIGIKIHYNQFLKGIIDSRSIVYLLVLIVLFLLLSVMNVMRKR